MIVKHNIPSYSITWLANTYDKSQSKGIIENYYIPESIEELINLCKQFYQSKEKFIVIGHTSNTYILPNTDIENLISTRKLTYWYKEDDVVVCECGVHVKQLVKSMVASGIEGYACMIDLPGTVGAAIYGNAGVSHDSISNVLISTDILCEDGQIRTMNHEDMSFGLRTSLLKKKEMEGIILSCKLLAKKGNCGSIQKEAEYVHDWRIKNHPGPSHNLGSTFIITNGKTLLGCFLLGLAKFLCIVLKPTNPAIFKVNIVLFLMGKRKLSKYHAGWNRYMWTDSNSHELFVCYKKVIAKLFKNSSLEIEEY